MLAAYSEGVSTGDAIRRTFGVSEEHFEQGYTAFLKQQVARLTTFKYPPEEDIDQLLKAHRGRPDDPDAAAAVARAYLDRGADKEALEAARAALKLRPKHQLATYVLARLRLKEKKTTEAVAMLEACLDGKAPEPNTLGLLASLNLKAEKYDEAIRLYALGEKLDPIHLQWTSGLARAYLASANQPKLAETLARLAKADADDLPVRKKLAQMALDRKDYPAAEDWARQAMEINVVDGDVHRVLAEALAARHNNPQAVEEAATAVELCPNDPQPRLLLKSLQEKP
jgi:tetratricopeptide (TPR) repeat protein